MLAQRTGSILNKMLLNTQATAAFSTANIHTKFEQAYKERISGLKRSTKSKPEIKNQTEYGKGYYQDRLRNMNQGY